MEIDIYWYAFMCILFGGILGIVIPYVSKVMDKKTKFSYSYFTGLIVSMSMAALILIPEEIDELTGHAIRSFVLAGFGIQITANMVTTKVRKSINESKNTK